MIEIMKSGHPLWNKTIAFAENCSWRAGAALAKRMRKNAFVENERVLVAFFTTTPNEIKKNQYWQILPILILINS